MKRPDTHTEILPLQDYREALQKAVNWLGDRYLLAEPTPRRKEELKGYFAAPRHWHGATGPGLQRRTH